MRFRKSQFVTLLLFISAASAIVVFVVESGFGALSKGRVRGVMTDGDINFVRDGELGPGASIDWYIMLDMPLDRRLPLKAGDEVRVIELPCLENHAKVVVLSGTHKGGSGWVLRDLITPRSRAKTGRAVLTVSLAGILIIAVSTIIRWVAEDPRAIYAHRSSEGSPPAPTHV